MVIAGLTLVVITLGCFLQLWLIKHVALCLSLDVGLVLQLLHPQMGCAEREMQCCIRSSAARQLKWHIAVRLLGCSLAQFPDELTKHEETHFDALCEHQRDVVVLTHCPPPGQTTGARLSVFSFSFLLLFLVLSYLVLLHFAFSKLFPSLGVRPCSSFMSSLP